MSQWMPQRSKKQGTGDRGQGTVRTPLKPRRAERLLLSPVPRPLSPPKQAQVASSASNWALSTHPSSRIPAIHERRIKVRQIVGNPSLPGRSVDKSQVRLVRRHASSIRPIVVTGGHRDHVGPAEDIKEMTGAKLAMHHREKDWLEKSMKVLPPGVTAWGRVFKAIMTMFMPLVRIPPTTVDLVLGDEECSLADYGIPGRIIYTPGHSMGSVSVLLETGDAFVGDLAMNEFPLRLSPGLPIFAESMEKVKESWRLLLNEGAKTVYPAHGKPFSIDVIRKVLA